MKSHLALTCLLLCACLESRTGRMVLDPDAADSGCPSSVPLTRVGTDVGEFAVGPCGALAYWHERSGRELRFLSPAHELVATHADPNGYSGTVALSPTGARVVASSLRSDLGFGDTIVGDVPTDGELVVDFAYDFGGASGHHFAPDERVYGVARPGYANDETWLHVEDGPSIGPLDALVVGGESLYYLLPDAPESPAPSGDGADATLHRLHLATGTTTILGRIRSAWLDGSTVRTRGEVRVSGDGSLALMGFACEPFAGVKQTCGWMLDRVIDGATGVERTRPPWWTDPVVGPGALVAATTQQGVGLIGTGGDTAEVIGHEVVKVLSDWVFTRAAYDGALYVVGADGDATRLHPGITAVTASSDGTRAALVDDAGHLWMWWSGDAQRVVAAAIDDTVTGVRSVYDDGVAILRGTAGVGQGEVIVVSGDGTEVARWPTDCIDTTARGGGDLWIALCEMPNSVLHRVDVGAGAAQPIAHGHDFDVRLDATGSFVAFTFTPLSGTRRELHAGRAPGR